MKTPAKKKEVQELVLVQLTEAEHIARSRSLTAALTALDELILKHKDTKKKLKLEEDNANEAIATLREIVDSGQEQRPVACYEDPDFKKGTVTIRRQDTDAIVSTRQMTDEERQTQIETLGPKAVANHPDAKKPDERA